jgi:hypothetical protein
MNTLFLNVLNIREDAEVYRNVLNLHTYAAPDLSFGVIASSFHEIIIGVQRIYLD